MKDMGKVCLTRVGTPASFGTNKQQMPTYTFTTLSSYALGTHTVTFTKSTITIKLTSTGQKVYEGKFSNAPIAFMCSGNDFCIGTLNDNGTFSHTVDFTNRRAAIWLIEQNNNNKFIGSENETDPGVYNKYAVNECPVRLSSNGTVVTMECPCESSGGPCGNSCYTYG
jgi:hypothetical protein